MPSLGYIQKGPKVIPNKVNNGGGGNAFIVHYGEDGIFDKTWNEIHNALMQGIPAYAVYTDTGGDVAVPYYLPIFSASLEDEGYCVRVYTFEDSSMGSAFCDSADGYPYLE